MRVAHHRRTAISYEALQPIVRLLFRPVVRFCLRHAVKIQDASRALTSLFVEEATRALGESEEAPNVSRVAAITGIHRREVTRLLKGGVPTEREPPLLRKVLGRWQSHPDYRKGKLPRPLLCEGSESEFAQLVREVSQDLNPYTVLFELERAELVERVDGKVKLLRQVYIPIGDRSQGFELLAYDIEDLITTVEHNTIGKPEYPEVHIKTHYDNITPEALPRIRAWFKEKGLALHAEARAFLSRFDLDLNPQLKGKRGGMRVGIGSFSFTNEPVEEKKSVVTSKKSRVS